MPGVSVLHADADITLEEGEETRLTTRVLAVHSSGREGSGTLVVTTHRVVWFPAEQQPGGLCHFSLYFPAIAMHAICRDTSDFRAPCIYLQLDPEQNLGGLTFMGESAPRMTGDGAAANGGPNGHECKRQRGGADDAGAEGASGSAAAPDGMDDDEGEDGEEDDDDEDEDEDETWQEIRFVPEVAEGGAEAADAALGTIFSALCECAALNPDEDASDDEGEEEEMFDMGNPEEALASATESQLSMLERYDAMLDSAAGDGRFDDADEPGDEEPGAQ
jgi:hypothetical protein